VEWLSVLFRQARRILLTALLGGLLGATLVRLSPGFGVDERELDFRLSRESQTAAQSEHKAERNIAVFYLHYLTALTRGDFGFSRSLNRPVAELLRQRLPLTLVSLAWGALGGIALGFSLAILTLAVPGAASNLLGTLSSGLMLSLPAAVIALGFLWLGEAGRWAITLIVFPHVYRYAKNALAETARSPHVLAAEARGVSRGRIILAHIVAPTAPQMFALAGISVSLAFGASIPVEAICDMPGIGQLAWQAALSRDLPLLVNITVLIAVLTLAANAAADLAAAAWSPAR
jgi:peptide/nickel transport system permease protein